MNSLYSGHLGTRKSVLITEVATFQGFTFILRYILGTSPSVLTEVASFQGSRLERVHCNTEVASFQGSRLEGVHCSTVMTQ